MDTSEFAALIRRRLRDIAATPMGAARRARLPRDAIRSVFRGHEPRLSRVAEICEALGLQFYIGPKDRSLKLGAFTRSGEINDELAIMLHALSAGWDKSDERGQMGLRIRFWAHFPELQLLVKEEPAEEPATSDQMAS